MGVFYNRLLACMVMVSLVGSAWAAEEALMNDTLKTILARKSVRSYRSEPVSDEKLQMLVRAGMAAPTAVDKRPWEFVVVTDRAAAAIVVGGDVRKQWGGMESDYWIMDCSAATQNILLAAESMGLGAVWTAVYPEDSRVRAVRQILGIPPHVVPLNVIPVGVPAGREKPKDKYDPKQIHWNKW